MPGRDGEFSEFASSKDQGLHKKARYCAPHARRHWCCGRKPRRVRDDLLVRIDRSPIECGRPWRRRISHPVAPAHEMTHAPGTQFGSPYSSAWGSPKLGDEMLAVTTSKRNGEYPRTATPACGEGHYVGVPSLSYPLLGFRFAHFPNGCRNVIDGGERGQDQPGVNEPDAP